MAIVTTKSTTITNLDATPSVLPNVRTVAGRTYKRAETVAVAVADDDTSQYRFFRVNAQDTISSVKVFCDAITGGDDYSFGFYEVNDGAVVDADAIGAIIDLESAITVGLEIRFDAANITTVNQKVWQLAGVASDPGNKQYDFAATALTVGATAGDIVVIMEYNAGS